MSLRPLAAALGFLAAVFSGPAQAGLSELSLGVTKPQPMSSAGATLNRPIGGMASVWVDLPSILPPELELNFKLEYMPYQFVNTGAATGIQANLSMIGAYAGMTLWGAPSVLGVRPYFMGGLGVVYDYLTLPAASGVVSNTGTAFAFHFAPGFDLPIVKGLGVVIEMPVTVALFKTALVIWEPVFALRWKL